jgi:hypothetical protein
MKPIRKTNKVGKTKPKKSEARTTAPTVSGPKSKGESKPADHSVRPFKSKAKDSRTQVIEKSHAPKVGILFHATSPAKRAALIRLRDTHPGSSVRAQQDRLEMALRRWPLTFQEMWQLGLQDGRARIYGLRQRGLDITKIWVVIETDYGQRHRVGLYSLRRGGTVPAVTTIQPDLFRDATSAGAGCAAAVDGGQAA